MSGKERRFAFIVVVALAAACTLAWAGCTDGNWALPVGDSETNGSITTGNDTAGTTTGTPADSGSSTTDNPGGSGSNSGGSPSSTADPDVTDACILVGTPASSKHQEMLAALNDFRKSKSLSTLKYSKVLEKAANAHAQDMFVRDFFDHTNPDGKTPMDRAKAAGFCRARLIGENIAWNYPSVDAVQTGWENSPGHYANMVNTGYKYVGMGYYMSSNGPYYVQLFGDAFARQ